MKERGIFAFVFVLVVFLGSPFFVSAANVSSSVDISNSPPMLSSNIPNQSWQVNQNLTNAFDLDNYFYDPNGDTIIYSYSTPANITVFLSPDNVVSFYPDAGYIGISSMLFYASDGSVNSTSNLVYLNVGSDSEPPKWSSPSRSITTVYQNNYVNFTTLWTDNFALKDYLFYISQSGANSSYYNMTGIQNVSRQQVQISAAAGSTIYWYFCARDANTNVNCTDTQNFTVATPSTPTSSTSTSTSSSTSSTSSGSGGDSGGVLGGLFGSATKKLYNFTYDPELFKVPLKQGDTETRVLTITNIGNQNISFVLKSFGLDNFLVLSEDEFVIPFGESKTVTLDFSAGQDVAVDEYNGKIILNSSIGASEVPVVLDVNAREYEFEISVNLSEDSKRVSPGDEVYATINIFNLKDIPFSDINLYYAIKDFEGNIYDSKEEGINLESSVSLERTLNFPKDATVGNYIFYARVQHNSFAAVGSDDFYSGSRFDFASFFRYTFFIVLIIILSAVALVLFLRYRREKEKERLLNLYLMLTEMKKLIKEGKVDDAVDLYIRIKSIYGEPVSETTLKNKEELKSEINKLSSRLKKEVSQTDEKTQQEIKEASESKKDEPKGEVSGGQKKEEEKTKELSEEKNEENAEEKK